MTTRSELTSPDMETPNSSLNSLLELYTSIVCACLPCLTPLIKRHLLGRFSTSRNQRLSSRGALSSATSWLTSSAFTITRLTESIRRQRRMPNICRTEGTGCGSTVIRTASDRENSIRDWVELLAANGIIGEETDNLTWLHISGASDSSTRRYDL